MGEEQKSSIHPEKTLTSHNAFLGSFFPVVPLDLGKIWGNFSHFYVEVGFGNGEFLVHLAKKNPDAAFLGIEWSKKSVEKALKRIAAAGLTNIRLVLEDARVAIPLLLPEGNVTGFYFNFPDPWFKRRHKKHRLLSSPLLKAMHGKLKSDGFVEVVTDWTEYAYWIIDQVSSTGIFNFSYPYPHFVNYIPGRFMTKYARIHHLGHGDPIFYIRFVKK